MLAEAMAMRRIMMKVIWFFKAVIERGQEMSPTRQGMMNGALQLSITWQVLCRW